MKIEIDQSGKVEQTGKDTILAISNEDWDTVIIKAKTKRRLQEIFRRHGQTQNFVLFTFSAGLAILIKRNNKYGKVTIDLEYAGKEPVIKELVIEILSSETQIPQIYFKSIGKLSNAHHYAHDTATKEIKPKKTIGFEELFLTIKKTEVGKRLKNA